jgi:hypothetical protein
MLDLRYSTSLYTPLWKTESTGRWEIYAIFLSSV